METEFLYSTFVNRPKLTFAVKFRQQDHSYRELHKTHLYICLGKPVFRVNFVAAPGNPTEHGSLPGKIRSEKGSEN